MLKISAATLHGRVVFFDVDQPWEQSQPFDAMFAFAGITAWLVSVRTGLWMILIFLAVGVAWRNIRLGQADWSGTFRVAVAVFGLAVIDWLLGSPHTLVIPEELSVGFLWLNDAVFSGVISGAAYLAVEPLARRRWPWSIITTRRLLAGRLADRGVWTDLLLGLVVGLGVVVLFQLAALAGNRLVASLGGLHHYGLGLDLLNSFGLRYKVSVLIRAMLVAVIEALLLLSFLVAIRRQVKSTTATVLIFVIVLTLVGLLGRRDLSPVDVLFQASTWGIVAILLARSGLLTAIATMATVFTVNNTPITTQLSAWYAPASLSVQGMLVAGLLISWWLGQRDPRART